MRFKIFFNKLTNTLTIFEDDTAYVLLFLLLVFVLFIKSIITFFFFLAVSVFMVIQAKNAKTPDLGSMTLAVGSMLLGAAYCVLISLCIYLGVGSSSFILMLQVFSVATAVYSLRFSAHNKNLIVQQMSSQNDILAAEKCRIASRISLVTLISLIAFFACLYALDVPSPEDTRNRAQTIQAEALIAESVSVWDLETMESNAIYGNATKFDSQGNAYRGEFREFCAWSYPGNVFEPSVTVDINEKYEYTRFTGTIFTRPDQKEELAITFKIYADGKCIYNSGEMHASTPAIDLDLNVSDVNTLRFQAYTDSNDATNPAVILVDAVLHAD